MLCGSTAIKMGARWKEHCILTPPQNPPLTELIESCQQHAGLSAGRGHPAPHRCPTRRTALCGRTMANNVIICPKLNPIAEPVAAHACCLASGSDPVSAQASHSAAFSARRRSWSAHSASSLIPPSGSLTTACATRWAWWEIDVRLSPVSWARRVTAPQHPLKAAAALPIQMSTAPLHRAVSLPHPS